MDVKNLKILVIIVTYNAMRWIDKCLTSLLKSSIPVDCIIIDNKSSDYTVETIKRNYSFCKIIESKDNLGFGKANNIGLQYAVDNDYDFVYLLNQDAWIFPDTISVLIRTYQSHREYGILSPLQMNATCSKLDKNFQICCPMDLISDSICGCLKDVYPTTFVMAAHWLIPRQSLLSIGGFSPSFPHYGEDNNYVHRIIYKQYKIGIVPKAKAVHDREFRIDSKSLMMRKGYMHSISIISDPNKKPYKNLFIQSFWLFKRCIKLKSLDGLKYIYALFVGYHKIIKNRKLSLQFAFLKK